MCNPVNDYFCIPLSLVSFEMSRNASFSPVVRGPLAPFAEKLKAAPHRDATNFPYGQWFRLYVDFLKGIRLQQQLNKMGPVEAASALAYAKRSIDTALWSSVLAEHWKQVVLPTQEPPTATPLWYGKGGATLAPGSGLAVPSNVVLTRTCPDPERNEKVRPGEASHTRQRGQDLEIDGCVGGGGSSKAARFASSSTEILSPGFLSEPLAGGAAVADWMAVLRQRPADEQGPATTPRPQGWDDRNPGSWERDGPTFHVVLPFSALFQLKYEAHLRSNVSSNTGQIPVLSVQERRARQTLLQALHQALQLQEEISTSSRGRSPRLLQLHAWAPTQEFDALCELPRVRPLLSRKEAHNESEAGLSLALLCESMPARLVFLSKYAVLKNTLQAHSETDSKKQAEETTQLGSMPVALLAHGSELRLLRALGAPLVRERSTFAAWQQQLMHVLSTRARAGATTTQRSGTVAGANLPSSSLAHQQAWRGCGEMIRRMTAREENLRQSFSQR